MKIHFYWRGMLVVLFCMSATAADLNRLEVEKRLAKADKNHPADLRRKELTDLDLSGLDFKIADLVHDGQILQLARSTAQTILSEDEHLTFPENQLLVQQLASQAKSKSSWSKIG